MTFLILALVSKDSYDNLEMTLKWQHKNGKDPVEVAQDIQIPSYSLTSVKWSNKTDVFTTGNEKLLIHPSEFAQSGSSEVSQSVKGALSEAVRVFDSI